MDVGKVSDYLPDAATCTLCMDVFLDPVTLACGHNYCQACIQRHWGGLRSGVACPQCQQGFGSVTLVLNRQLGNVSWLIRKLQDKGVLRKPNRGFCQAHGQLLIVFCQNDQGLLCSECQLSQDHAGHTLASLEEAARSTKGEAGVFLDLLKFQKEHLHESYLEVKAEKENLEQIVERDNQRFSSGYKEMYEAVKSVQREQMAAAKWIREEIERELTRLARNYNEIRAFAKELKRKIEEPSYEFLKDIKEVMARCKGFLAQPPGGHLPPFEEKMWDLALRSLFVHNAMERCRDALPLQSVVERVEVTLDRLTAHPHLLLSASKKTVTHDATPSGLPPGRLAFDTAPCVLAERGFWGGRHCWQVEVTSSGQGWAFGVMKGSVSRQGPVGFSADDGVWALQPEHLPAGGPLRSNGRFRLYLDYEGGTLHFFDAATREPVALFSYAVFLGEEVFPFFKLEEPRSQMRVTP